MRDVKCENSTDSIIWEKRVICVTTQNFSLSGTASLHRKRVPTVRSHDIRDTIKGICVVMCIRLAQSLYFVNTVMKLFSLNAGNIFTS
jgi:hypothetical protein